MTNLEQTHRGDKRRRLVESACRLVHEHGVAGTTLADLAKDADVVVGNIYYYFKTKDELVQAVIEAHVDDIRTVLSAIDKDPDPRARLKAFARSLADLGDVAARRGCPRGTLCVELGKRDDGLDTLAATMMSAYVDWAQEQFRLLGVDGTAARDHAVTLVSVYQGSSLLVNAFRDPGLMSGRVRQLEAWIDTMI
jgi:AcrR family transcriptional regulator